MNQNDVLDYSSRHSRFRSSALPTLETILDHFPVLFGHGPCQTAQTPQGTMQGWINCESQRKGISFQNPHKDKLYYSLWSFVIHHPQSSCSSRGDSICTSRDWKNPCGFWQWRAWEWQSRRRRTIVWTPTSYMAVPPSVAELGYAARPASETSPGQVLKSRSAILYGTDLMVVDA